MSRSATLVLKSTCTNPPRGRSILTQEPLHNNRPTAAVIRGNSDGKRTEPTGGRHEEENDNGLIQCYNGSTIDDAGRKKDSSAPFSDHQLRYRPVQCEIVILAEFPTISSIKNISSEDNLSPLIPPLDKDFMITRQQLYPCNYENIVLLENLPITDPKNQLFFFSLSSCRMQLPLTTSHASYLSSLPDAVQRMHIIPGLNGPYMSIHVRPQPDTFSFRLGQTSTFLSSSEDQLDSTGATSWISMLNITFDLEEVQNQVTHLNDYIQEAWRNETYNSFLTVSQKDKTEDMLLFLKKSFQKEFDRNGSIDKVLVIFAFASFFVYAVSSYYIVNNAYHTNKSHRVSCPKVITSIEQYCFGIKFFCMEISIALLLSCSDCINRVRSNYLTFWTDCLDSVGFILSMITRNLRKSFCDNLVSLKLYATWIASRLARKVEAIVSNQMKIKQFQNFIKQLLRRKYIMENRHIQHTCLAILPKRESDLLAASNSAPFTVLSTLFSEDYDSFLAASNHRFDLDETLFISKDSSSTSGTFRQFQSNTFDDLDSVRIIQETIGVDIDVKSLKSHSVHDLVRGHLSTDSPRYKVNSTAELLPSPKILRYVNKDWSIITGTNDYASYAYNGDHFTIKTLYHSSSMNLVCDELSREDVSSDDKIIDLNENAQTLSPISSGDSSDRYGDSFRFQDSFNLTPLRRYQTENSVEDTSINDLSPCAKLEKLWKEKQKSKSSASIKPVMEP